MCHEDYQGSGEVGEPPLDSSYPVGDTQIQSWTYTPGGDSRGVVIVAPDIWGPNPFYHELSRMLAGQGYTAVLIDFLSRCEPMPPDPPRELGMKRLANLDEPLSMADLSIGIDRARETTHGRVGLLTFCISGIHGFNLTTERDDLAVVSYYGFPRGVPFPPDKAGPGRVPSVQPITLVDKMRGPILALWGDQDKSIPPDVVREFSDALIPRDIDYRWHLYEGAGHGFLSGLLEDNSDSEAARDAWKRTLEFFSRHVAAPIKETT
ncbi:MAG: dienelactone hydrolase family protein [Halieaceae bacterium]|nr:dienelactone hydrolase family protein [Halieaceae bacterium]